jgi:hypothetical protein
MESAGEHVGGTPLAPLQPHLPRVDDPRWMLQLPHPLQRLPVDGLPPAPWQQGEQLPEHRPRAQAVALETRGLARVWAHLVGQQVVRLGQGLGQGQGAEQAEPEAAQQTSGRG